MRVALAVLLVGCGQSALDQLEAKLGRLLCQHQIGCGVYDGSYESLCEQQQAELDGADLPLDVTVHSDQTDACLNAVSTALAAAPCARNDAIVVLGQHDVVAACDKALAGNIAPRASCTLNIECAQPAVCELLQNQVGCSLCVAADQSVGGPCTSFECADGSYCKSGVCTPLAQAGQACDYFECVSGLYCAAGPTGKTCQPPAASGMACDPNLGFCATGLVCNATSTPPTCTPPVAEGGACTQDTECAPPMLCSKIGGNTCRAPSPLGGSCGTQGDCLEPLVCFNGNCIAPNQLGDNCTQSADCAVGWCNRQSGKCEARLPVGASCDPNASGQQCATGVCDLTSHSCVRC